MADSDLNDATSRIGGVAKENIESVAQIEYQFIRERSVVDRLGERITNGVGTVSYALIHLCFVLGWIAVNTGYISFVPSFDPYPFSFLGVIVSLEAVSLSTFVLMTQKRQTRQADHWAHLNLQIGILAEQEATKMLQILTAISGRLGLATSHDSELREMVEKTIVNDLAKELAENLEKMRATDEPVG